MADRVVCNFMQIHVSSPPSVDMDEACPLVCTFPAHCKKDVPEGAAHAEKIDSPSTLPTLAFGRYRAATTSTPIFSI